MTISIINRDDHRQLQLTSVGDLNDKPAEYMLLSRNATRTRRSNPSVELICHGRFTGNRHLILVCESFEDMQTAYDDIRSEDGSVQWETAVIAGRYRTVLTPYAGKTVTTDSGFYFRSGATVDGAFTCGICAKRCTKETHFHVSRASRPEIIALLRAHGCTAKAVNSTGSPLYVQIGIASCESHFPLIQRLAGMTNTSVRLYRETLDQLKFKP